MAAAGGQGRGRGRSVEAGGNDVVGTPAPKVVPGLEPGLAAGASIGNPPVRESGRRVSPSPRLSPDPPLSPGLKDRVLEAVRSVRPEPASDQVPRPPQSVEASGARNWLPWVCAAAAGLALVFSMGNQRRLDREIAVYQAGLVELAGQVRELQARLDREGGALSFLNDPGVRALLLSGTPKSPQARGAVFWSGQERKVRLYTTRLPQLSKEKTYQLWLIADEPVDAGTFRVNPAGQGFLEVVDLAGPSPPVEIAVSMEPAGGAPQLTGDIYLTGSF